MDFTLRSGPSNKFSLGCHRDSFQKCHSITPPTEGWLKYMVKRFPKASAFLTSSASSTVNSVAQISRPASASLSILYCTHIERFFRILKCCIANYTCTIFSCYTSLYFFSKRDLELNISKFTYSYIKFVQYI